MRHERARRDDERDAGADRIVLDRGVRRTAIRLPRHGVAILALLFLGLLVWSVGAAGYVVFHDTVVAELRRHSNESARGYETEISALKTELERVRTRRLVEKTGIDERIDALTQRQAAIEKRQSKLSEIAEAGAGDLAETRDPAFTSSLKPQPMDRDDAALDGPGAPAGPMRKSSLIDATEKVAASLDAVEARQSRALDGIGAKTGERLRRLAKVYDAAGVRRPGLDDGRGRGGPYEPLPPSALTFELRLGEVSAERGLVRTLERGLDRVPIRTPSPGASVSSGFGARVDPFLGRPAFHAGIDFEGDLGEPVRATAAGKVISAGWSGGYGNMVEVDHGDGLTTRFGHLSAILVKEGDAVRPGSTLGRTGSTGRSTGPHVHYETRVNGEAVNPLRFLNAGRILAAAE